MTEQGGSCFFAREPDLIYRRAFVGQAVVLAGFLIGWGCFDSYAQGSMGGTIGKTNKSVSGTRSSAPERPAPRSKPKSGARGAPAGGGGGSVSRFDGEWNFVATGCGAGMMRGVISGSKISIGDGGGQISASGSVRISFTTMTGLNQVAVGRLSGVTGAGSYSRANGCAGRWTATKQSIQPSKPEMDRDAQLQHALQIDLRNALIRDEFDIYYQLILDVASHEPCGAEALVRWRHPQLGLLGPDRFIPIAENTGFIIPLGEWILRKACMEAATWPAQIKLASQSLGPSVPQPEAGRGRQRGARRLRIGRGIRPRSRRRQAGP